MRGDRNANPWQKIQIRADRIEKIDKNIKQLQDKRYILHCEMEELLEVYERQSIEAVIGCDDDGTIKSA